MHNSGSNQLRMTKKSTGISQDRHGAAAAKRPPGIWHPCPAHDISAASTAVKPMADIACTENAGAATGGVGALLRLEGLPLFAGMTLLDSVGYGSWLS